MDVLIYLKALLLGLVEGITEFLPISSTGHLIITADLIGFSGDEAKTFVVAIQLGAILAICWFFRAKISKVVSGLPGDKAARRFVANIVAAFIPAAILGLLLHEFIKDYLFTPITVAVAIIVGGFVILWVEQRPYAPRIETVDDMDWRDALKVGLCQCFALIPGTSRSGSTIMGGLFFGLSRQAAAEFSFFLAIPIMLAATLFDVAKSWHLLHSEDLPLFAIGFVAAFLSALLAVKALLRFISQHSFRVFAYYRIVFGVIVLWYFW